MKAMGGNLPAGMQMPQAPNAPSQMSEEEVEDLKKIFEDGSDDDKINLIHKLYMASKSIPMDCAQLVQEEMALLAK